MRRPTREREPDERHRCTVAALRGLRDCCLLVRRLRRTSRTNGCSHSRAANRRAGDRRAGNRHNGNGRAGNGRPSNGRAGNRRTGN